MLIKSQGNSPLAAAIRNSVVNSHTDQLLKQVKSVGKSIREGNTSKKTGELLKYLVRIFYHGEVGEDPRLLRCDSDGFIFGLGGSVIMIGNAPKADGGSLVVFVETPLSCYHKIQNKGTIAEMIVWAALLKQIKSKLDV